MAAKPPFQTPALDYYRWSAHAFFVFLAIFSIIFRNNSHFPSLFPQFSYHRDMSKSEKELLKKAGPILCDAVNDEKSGKVSRALLRYKNGIELIAEAMR